MLTATRKTDDKQVMAKDAERSDGPFYCSFCESDATLRKGIVVSHHFAHKPPITCEYGTGESELHRQTKQEIYDFLSTDAGVTKLALERNLKTVRPDVSCYIGKTPIAIEVQLSSLSLERIAHRTLEYAKKKIYVLWISPNDERLTHSHLTIRSWEKWVHALYFGRIYFWDDQQVAVYNFIRRRYRKVHYHPRLLHKVDLVHDLEPVHRSAWTGHGLSLPDCKLFADTSDIRNEDAQQ